MPPSLELPEPVNNLSASRTGDEVSLRWTMPRKTTDKLMMKGSIPVRVCRQEGEESCQTAPGALFFNPNALGIFRETLPSELASGPPRPLSYFIELKNGKGRSGGLSNAATVLAGTAPPAIEGLAAEMSKRGVVLHWEAGLAEVGPGASLAGATTLVRLQRKLLNPTAGSDPEARANDRQGMLAPEREPVEQSLVVETSGDAGTIPHHALDKTIRFGRTYEYRAQRFARVTVGGQTLELPGPLSAPVQVVTEDRFPPGVPTDLAAVATQADANESQGSGLSIDLSWQPVIDSDLAGYGVYRREGNGAWQRISPPQPVVGPGFHDPHVEGGHTYQYSVTAIDQGGRESARSKPTDETVPIP